MAQTVAHVGGRLFQFDVLPLAGGGATLVGAPVDGALACFVAVADGDAHSVSTSSTSLFSTKWRGTVVLPDRRRDRAAAAELIHAATAAAELLHLARAAPPAVGDLLRLGEARTAAAVALLSRLDGALRRAALEFLWVP